MRRLGVLCGLIALVCCGCSLPHHKDVGVIDKLAATRADATTVLIHYNRVRTQADTDRDVATLRAVETGALLQIDAGLYHVSRVLDPGGSGARSAWTQPTEYVVPRLRRYPLWFVLVVENPDQKTQVAVLFNRASSTSSWKATYAPQLAATTRLPALADQQGGAVSIDPEQANGLPYTPVDLLARYCRALSDPNSNDARDFPDDAFIAQMRQVRSRTDRGNVRVTQTWTPMRGSNALRTADGGALVFGSVQRKDTFHIVGGKPIRWKKSNPAAAFDPNRIRSAATVTYVHQLLFYVPPRSLGNPRVIGQVGGVVNASSR